MASEALCMVDTGPSQCVVEPQAPGAGVNVTIYFKRTSLLARAKDACPHA